jgi:sugar phosphate isomerase/epimerase
LVPNAYSDQSLARVRHLIRDVGGGLLGLIPTSNSLAAARYCSASCAVRQRHVALERAFGLSQLRLRHPAA